MLRRFLLLALVCAAAATVSASAPLGDELSSVALAADLQAAPFPCTFEAEDGTYFDFSPLTTPRGAILPGGNMDSYNVNVCGTTPGVADCETSTLCMEFQYFPGEWYSIAEYANTPASNPPTFSLVNHGNANAGVQLVYNNGNYKGTPAQVHFKFICGAGTTVIRPDHDSASHWTVTVTSPDCCPVPKPGGGGGGGGLSGGWIFIIIVLVCTSVYIIGGCVYKHQKQGTQGIESCPNIDVWRDFPGLVKDGCRFTYAKLQGLMGKRGSGGATSYENMS